MASRNEIMQRIWHRLKTDIDVYNEKFRGKNPEIQLVLDYSDDVAEREELQRMRNRRDAA
jgi:hypothetical protein